MSDQSAVDAALVAKLQNDVVLAGYAAAAGDFVFFDQAPPGSTGHVIVSLVEGIDVPEFGRTAFEDLLYQVKFVALSSAGANVGAAAARIHDLLDHGDLDVPGYKLMVMRRVSPLRVTEVNTQDASIRWFHRGGRYQVMVAATS